MLSMRRLMVLGLLGAAVACARPADAQGLWMGGLGYGPGFFGPGYGSGLVPVGFGHTAFFGGVPGGPCAEYPVAPVAVPVVVARPVVVAQPVVVARPVVYAAPVPIVAARPAVRLPLNRAYRRAYRFGW